MRKKLQGKILIGMLMFGLIFALSGCPASSGSDEGTWPGGGQPGNWGRPAGGGGGFTPPPGGGNGGTAQDNFAGYWDETGVGDGILDIFFNPNEWFFENSQLEMEGEFTVVSPTQLTLTGDIIWGGSGAVSGTATFNAGNNTLSTSLNIPGMGNNVQTTFARSTGHN